MTKEITTSIQLAIAQIEQVIENLKKKTKEKKADLRRHQKMLALAADGDDPQKEER